MQNALLEVKEYLTTVHREDNTQSLEEKELLPSLELLRRRLEASELIEPEEQAPLVKALHGKIDANVLSAWSKAIDAMDYDVALEIMNQWEIQ